MDFVWPGRVNIPVGIAAAMGMAAVLAFVVLARHAANSVFLRKERVLSLVAGKKAENCMDNDELTVVITAAVLSSMRASGETHAKIRVKSFRRTSQTMPVWSSVWRNEQLAGKH